MDSPTSSPTIHADSADSDLIAALAEHNIDALSYLYDRYSPLVYSLAFQILHNEQEAQTITQKTFLKLWHRGKLHEPQQISIHIFLINITRALALQWLHKQSASPDSQTPSDFLPPWQKLPNPHLHDSQDYPQASIAGESLGTSAQAKTIRSLIYQALEQLSPQTQTILTSLYFQGQPSSRIAQQSNLSVGVVELRSRQALKALRHTLRPIF